ncbi:MAG: Maf family protein [Spirochaetes bacterium]|nr:Maf family protein [Spirochaetota bacterium]
MRVVLASKSPRRKELLKGIIENFEIIAPNIDETPFPSENPVFYAERLSTLKAFAVANFTKEMNTCLIIASDTIVTVDDIILGKPVDYADACRMLSLLSGKTHNVYTAITLMVHNETNTILTETEMTRVTFKQLKLSDIHRYLGKIEWHDKAGSYAVQNESEMIIDRVDGSLTNVIGFPLRRFFSMVETLALWPNILYSASK